MSKTDEINNLCNNILRQYPIWPSTFSTCCCGRDKARGGGECNICLTEKLGAIIGRDKAEEFNFKAKEFSSFHASIVFYLEDNPEED